MRLVIEGREPAWIPVFFTAARSVEAQALKRRADPATGYDLDVFGVEFINAVDGPTPAHAVNGRYRLTDVTRWREAMPEIDLKSVDWEEDSRKILSLADQENKYLNYVGAYVWEEFHYLLGFEAAFKALIKRPEETAVCLEAIADFWIEAMRRQYKYLKPDIIMIQDHIANADGLLMSPKTYREIIKPAQRKVVEAIADLGAIPQMHVDGNVGAVVGDYAEMGVRMIQPFQVYNDINACKEKYGFIAVGGWDSFGRGNQEDTTEEEARASVRLALDTYGPGNRYVFWASGLTPSYPHIARWVGDEAEKYGRDFFKAERR
jgi:hypothetical protein